jgi:hypothetical protein
MWTNIKKYLRIRKIRLLKINKKLIFYKEK